MTISSSAQSRLFAERPALVVGHPGHELLIHGWLERARPIVFVLTDGSGGAGQARLASTTRILENVGARRGSIYGALSDRQIYQILLDQQLDALERLLDNLSNAFITEQIQCVAGDSAEGYNPTHDLCRILVNAAVARAERRGCRIANYEVPHSSRPASVDHPEAIGWEAVTLDEAAFVRKLAAADGYPEMAGEVARALSTSGPAAFRTEWFLRAKLDPTGEHATRKPYYETFGERRVADGLYARVLRYQEHMAPAVAHLARLVESAHESCASSSRTSI